MATMLSAIGIQLARIEAKRRPFTKELIAEG